jgi:hypothetical protein
VIGPVLLELHEGAIGHHIVGAVRCDQVVNEGRLPTVAAARTGMGSRDQKTDEKNSSQADKTELAFHFSIPPVVIV